MIPMSGDITEQNNIKIEINEDSSPIPKSPEKKLMSNNLEDNSNIKQNIPNNLLNSEQINIFLKELQNIAKTGDTLYSWEQLKPSILYFYEKNVKNFEENKKAIGGLNFSEKKSIGDIGLNFFEKKSNSINNSKELELNLINDHDNFNDYDRHNINSNIFEDLNFHLSNNSGNLNLHEQNINFTKPEKIYINNENITNDIIDYINKIKIMPFTIQRIAELLLEPEKDYTSLAKYNRAFNKLVNIDFY